MTSRTHNDGDVLLDDGTYFIESNPAASRDGSAGCLMRRCDRATRDVGAAECVGAYAQAEDGKWRVAITSYYDARTDSETHEVGVFANRLDAICTLWKSRHDAIGRNTN
ncbi:hypothetical protein [Burkholderia gladioli]|uniref:hypothetical protein n=1 Tax=Burkholderia gladioli TaxID=28095 RepID=UPI00163E4E87|nr:hypothetical protein [Burkholderia gladioli]